MGFSSLDDLVTEITTNGKYNRTDWNKITGAAAYTAGRWYDMSALNGTPTANTFSGTALACQNTSSASNFGLYTGGNVSSDTKHVLNVAAVTGVATGVPSMLCLVDMQCYWPGINMNSASAQTLTGTPTLRYTNGVGCRLMLVVTATTGATAHNLSVSYSNTVPTAGRTLPVTVACTPSAIVPHITHSGTSANNYGPFLPLAAGDLGVSNVATVTLSAGSLAGTAALCLVRPLLNLPLTTVSVAAERDLLNQLPSLPRVYDDSCLTWLIFTGGAVAAATNFYGSVDVGWG